MFRKKWGKDTQSKKNKIKKQRGGKRLSLKKTMRNETV